MDDVTNGEGRGIVGSRRLVAVQMIDIGRLPAAPVYLATNSLVAVTGRGPTDSNESSKTVFFGAVSLLLDDPGWNLQASQAGQLAAKMLFDPPNAPKGTTMAADHGYVVGVFAGDDDRLVTEPLTVWLRINRSGDPYIAVRHRAGRHLADHATQQAASEDGDRIWADLKVGGTLGSQTFGRRLYGDGARCLSYVATRGGKPEQRDRTLLGSDVSQLSPERIAEELIALGGLKPRFDDEREHRAAYLRHHKATVELAGKVQEARETHAEYAAAAAAARQLDEDLSAAVELRRRAIAQATVETLEKVRDDQARHMRLAEDAAKAADAHEQARDRLAELSPDRIDTEHAAATEAYTKAEEAATAADRVVTLLARKIDGEQDRLAELRTAAGAWDGTPPEHARANADEAEGVLAAAERALAVEDAHARNAERHLEQVRDGDASPTVSALRAAGVDAVLLADAVEFADDVRQRWETLLYPFRDAVAVPPEQADRASDVAPAGTLILAADGPLPDGVHAAPAGAAGFLVALDATGDGGAAHATLFDGAATIIGGHAEPWTGRQARERAAEAAAEQAQAREAEARQARDEAAASAAAAETAAEAAEAHVAAGVLDGEIGRLRGDLADRRAELADRLGEKKAALSRLSDAQSNKDRAEERIAVLESEVERLSTAHQEAQREQREQRKAAAGRGLHEWAERLRNVCGADPDPDSDIHPLDVDADVLKQVEAAALEILGDEDRAASSLRQAASEALMANVLGNGLSVRVTTQPRQAHQATRHEVAAPADVPDHVTDATERFVRARGIDGDVFSSAPAYDDAFATLVEAVRATVADRVETADANLAQAEHRVGDLGQRLEAAEDELDQKRRQLDNVMSSLEQLASERLRQVSDGFDRINVRDGGWAADLKIEHDRPALDGDADAAAEWVWRATPRWARQGPGADGTVTKVAYDRDANTAQYKLHTVQLVLAALTAHTQPHGSVLVLDELGNDLGADHRERVVKALARAAEDSGITVLATVQDDLQPVAFRHAAEVVLLHYPDKSQYLNAPTKMLATDPTGGQVLRLLADVLRTDMPDLAWRPLLDVYEPDGDTGAESAVAYAVETATL